MTDDEQGLPPGFDVGSRTDGRGTLALLFCNGVEVGEFGWPPAARAAAWRIYQAVERSVLDEARRESGAPRMGDAEDDA